MERIKLDIAIIGAGPAGLSAAVYVKRSNHSFVIFEKEMPGGKVARAAKVDNYLGYYNVSGVELATKLTNHVDELGIEITYETVIEVNKVNNRFVVTTEDNTYEIKAVIVATGTKSAKLGFENEDKFFGRGVSYCATCDGMFFKNKNVAVLGEKELALKEALYLSNLASKVYIITQKEAFNADESLIQSVNAQENIEVVYNAKCLKIDGEIKVNKLVYSANNLINEIDIDGVFPYGEETSQYSFLKKLDVSLEKNFIKVNEYMESNIIGLFAAGDISNKPLKQIITAAGDGAIAATSAIRLVKEINKNEKN